MDTIDKLRNVVEKVLTEYAKTPFAYGEISCETIFDRERERYLLMTVGWEDERRVHGCLVHIDIISGKLWIQRDGSECGIANELVAAGILKEQIVLAFHPREIREHTEYAIG